MRQRTDSELIETHKVFYDMIRDYSDGHLGNQTVLHRARVEASDPSGGQLEANPPNPPRSVRARVYTSGLDATTPSEALIVFHPIGEGMPQPGEHVIVMFEDIQKTAGFWMSILPSFHDQNYANPDFREPNGQRNASYSFEGDPQVSSPVNPELEYGGVTTDTQGRQDMVDFAESAAANNPWQNKRVLLIGDSQVAGPWGTKLGDLLRANHEVSYFAKEGRVGWGVISWLNNRLRSDSPIQESIQSLISRHNPDIVVVSLGGNDGSSGRSARADYASKVRELFNIVSGVTGNTSGIVSSVSMVIWSGPPAAVGPNSDKQPNRLLAGRKIKQVVGNRFVDVSAITQTTQGRARDGIHFAASSNALEPWAEMVIRKGYSLLNLSLAHS